MLKKVSRLTDYFCNDTVSQTTELLAMNEPAEKINTKEALLEAAKELFTLKGYSAVSTREIADTAGVNLGAIQYHFGSKAQLFVESVLSLMEERKKNLDLYIQNSPAPEDKVQAAEALCKYIDLVLYEMCHPKGPDTCRIMHREVHGASSQDPELYEPLVSSVTEQFIRPMDEYLRMLIGTLKPDASEQELWIYAQSTIGQCLYYVTHRPFAQRLRGEDLARKDNISNLSKQICEFTLRGLGLAEDRVRHTLKICYGEE